MTDLAKWLGMLKAEEENVRARIREISSNRGVIAQAEQDARTNYCSCIYWIKWIHSGGFELQEDLTMIEADHCRDDEKHRRYAYLYRCFQRHLAKLKKVPSGIRDGMYEPDEER